MTAATRPVPGRSAAEVVATLTRLEPKPDAWVVSCVVPLDPTERATRKFLTQVSSRVHELEPTLDALIPDHGARESVGRDLERLLKYLKPLRRLPAGRSLALFASERLDLFEVVPLPARLRFRLVADRTPYVKDLLAVEAAFGRVLAAVVDRTRARVFEVTAFDAREVTDLVAVSTRGGKFHSDRGDSPGWGEHRFHNRIRTEKKRHFHAVSEELGRLDAAQPAHGVVLMAAGPACAELEASLSPGLAGKLLGTTNLLPRLATPAKVHAATLAVSEGHERDVERSLVALMEEELGEGRAVTGLRETLNAMFEGQVRALVVRADAAAHGFRCADDRLVLRRGDCRSGEPTPAPYLIDDLIEEAVRRGVSVTLLHEAGETGSIRDVAARLRYG